MHQQSTWRSQIRMLEVDLYRASWTIDTGPFVANPA